MKYKCSIDLAWCLLFQLTAAHDNSEPSSRTADVAEYVLVPPIALL